MRTMQGVMPSQKPAALSNGKQWFYQQGSKPCGPLTWTELKNLALTGALTPEDRVWSEGMADWKPGGAVPNLFPRRANSPAAEAPASTAGKWFEGLGVLLFGGTMGLAFLVFIGFIVWKGIKKTPSADTQVAVATTKAEPSAPKEAKDRPLETTEIFERCSPSVALVRRTGGGSGSGFLARPGLVVTNCHVVEGALASTFQVTFPSAASGKAPLRAILIHEDRKRDLAILQIESSSKPLPLADRECTPGERVVVIGSPGKGDGEVVANSVTDGIWSARTQLGDNQDWYQITANINPGNSGGPVFNNRGHVIGVVTLFLKGKQGMNYAVPHSEVARALERASSKDQRERDQVVAEHDLTVVFGKVGKASCLYLLGMDIYSKSMLEAINKGEKAGDGLNRASTRIKRRVSGGAGYFFDNECRTALPRVVGNKAAPEATRHQLEELISLHTELKEWFDDPHGTVKGYSDKTEEFAGRLKRNFESLRLKLGVNEDPRLTKGELEALGLP
jgi:S1-C subfamily serine protease